MAEDGEGGEKTEDASAHKLSKAREEGQVGKSTEIPSVFVVLAALVALYAFAWQIYQELIAVFHFNLDFDHIPEATDLAVIRLLYYHFQKMLFACLPVFGAVYLIALATNFAQVGFVISWKSLAPKLSRLDPINGFKQKFSSRSVIELLKTLAKVSIVSLVCYFAIKSEIIPIFLLHDTSVSAILLYTVKKGFWIGIKVCGIMLVVAFLDYAYQRWKFLEDQKMTKKEVKDEAKQMEGDPMIKSRIRQLQQEAARKRMMADVPEADVVVTNPTRLAVALKYDKQSMEAPTVLAKGADKIAKNIREIAREHDIPLVENKTLARNLYNDVEVGQQVPVEYYQAVAELLAYVYGLRDSGS